MASVSNQMEKQMDNQLTVIIKTTYGTERIYPACQQSARVADLMKSKTFTRQDVNALKAIGFTFTVQQQQAII
jgi:hypothetical protein